MCGTSNDLYDSYSVGLMLCRRDHVDQLVVGLMLCSMGRILGTVKKWCRRFSVSLNR